ncbi:MAG TPA: NADH-quinone oxidoreductase subunit C [Alphaproteobacteria bacterium]|jgi:NADH-quinone oxidoreductase subunit C|nr:NADH-quinone oxidoreductase subunit C [Alphaproteobacteria bacterium]HAD73092.1 NADH-quinone oxidoreductase subunit C [Alphaproteobacteria bacterium]
MNDFHDRLTKLVGHQCQAIEMKGGELVLHVALADLVSVLKAVRDDTELAVTQLSDLTAVDFPERPERFDVVYQMLSVNNNMRLRIITRADEGDIVPSVIGLFRSADWAEREVWDMFGIYFSGHPDMRRLLTDYGFEGHPLRKDFPLTGYVEVRYSDTERRVVYEPVHLNQEYRDFDFLSPWEGMQLPQVGDDSDTDEEQAGA